MKGLMRYKGNANAVASLENKIIHRKENEWIPTDMEEWYGMQYECPYCGHITIDANRFCPYCGKTMIGGDPRLHP